MIPTQTGSPANNLNSVLIILMIMDIAAAHVVIGIQDRLSVMRNGAFGIMPVLGNILK
jgi:hypothetical protein